MKVVACRCAGTPHKAYHLAAPDLISLIDDNFSEMPVVGAIPVAVIHNDKPAVTGLPVTEFNFAVSG